MRVTLRDERVLILRTPAIVGDSLIGFRTSAEARGARVAVALAEVRRVETRHVDEKRTLGMVAALAAAAAAAWAIIVYVAMSGGYT